MKIRWSAEAAGDFSSIIEYIHTQSPDSASRVADDIFDQISSLSTFPKLGRPGRINDTRDLVLWPLPFIAVYRVTTDA